MVWLSAGTAGQVTASLTVAKRQEAAVLPFRLAELSVSNSASQPVQAVLLRSRGGGPAIRYRLTVPPGAKANLPVALPAMAPVQDYDLTALGAGASAIGQAAASITWPAELVTADEFIDEAYLQWQGAWAPWPAQGRRNALLALAGLAAATAAALFLRSRFAQAAAVVGCAAMYISVVAPVLKGAGAVQAAEYDLVLYGPGAPPKIESFTVLSARRTARGTWRPAGVPYPVYPDRSEAEKDLAIVDPAEKTITLPLRPGTARVFRPGLREVRLPAARPEGTVRGQADTQAPRVEASLLHQRAVVVLNERVWAVPPGFGRVSLTLADDDAKLVSNLLAEPRLWALDRQDVRLLRYWLRTFREPDKAYLVDFAGEAGAAAKHRMDVLELLSAAAPGAATQPAG